MKSYVDHPANADLVSKVPLEVLRPDRAYAAGGKWELYHDEVLVRHRKSCILAVAARCPRNHKSCGEIIPQSDSRSKSAVRVQGGDKISTLAVRHSLERL